MAREPKTYQWDEISGDVWRGEAGNTEGWDLKKRHKGGVKEFRSDRNHLALETKAVDKDDAHRKFMVHPEYKAFHQD